MWIKTHIYLVCMKDPNLSMHQLLNIGVSNIFWEVLPRDSLGDATVGELDTASIAIAFGILGCYHHYCQRFENMAQQAMLRLFLKSLVNLTCSHQAGPEVSGSVSFLCGFYVDWLVF